MTAEDEGAERRTKCSESFSLLGGNEFYNAAFGGHVHIKYHRLPPSTPTSLDGVSLDSRVAGLPYESSSLAHPSPLCGPLPLKGTQGALRDWLSVSYVTQYPVPPILSFPLEGKSREAGKGVRGRASIGCAIAVLTANRRPVSFLFLIFGHTFGVRVQRVQRVQRVVVAASPQIIKRGGRGWRRGLCRRVVSPQGKRLTMICASLTPLHPLLSLTHWIFRSLMLPYKSSSHSANHVCCASLRSGSKETRKLAAIPMDMQALKLQRIESCPFDSYIPNFYLIFVSI